MLSSVAGGEAEMFFVAAAEVAKGFKAAKFRNIGDGFAFVAEHCVCYLQAVLTQIFHSRLSRHSPEHTAEIAFAEAAHMGKLLYGDVFVEIIAHTPQGGLDQVIGAQIAPELVFRSFFLQTVADQKGEQLHSQAIDRQMICRAFFGVLCYHTHKDFV